MNALSSMMTLLYICIYFHPLYISYYLRNGTLLRNYLCETLLFVIFYFYFTTKYISQLFFNVPIYIFKYHVLFALYITFTLFVFYILLTNSFLRPIIWPLLIFIYLISYDHPCNSIHGLLLLDFFAFALLTLLILFYIFDFSVFIYGITTVSIHLGMIIPVV